MFRGATKPLQQIIQKRIILEKELITNIRFRSNRVCLHISRSETRALEFHPIDIFADKKCGVITVMKL